MNKYLSKIIFVFCCSLALLIGGCNEEDNYNWKGIDPGIQYISGPDTVKGNNISKYNFIARPRGGSKFDWIVLKGPVSVAPNSIDGYIGEVIANSQKDTVAQIQVTETTYGGKTAVSNITFKIISFCPYNITQLVGNGKYTCYDLNKLGMAVYPANFTVIQGDTLVNNNFFYMGWKVKYVLSKDTLKEEIKVVKDYFNYNGDVVEVSGKGNYNTCTGNLTVNYAVTTLNGDTVENGSGKAEFKRSK
jgi:hypothetical protein